MATRSGKYYHNGTKRKRSSVKDTSLDNNNSLIEKEIESNVSITSMPGRELRGRKTKVADSDKGEASGAKIKSGLATESNWIISSVKKNIKQKGAKVNVDEEAENDINASNVLTKPLKRKSSLVKNEKANTTYEKDTEDEIVPEKEKVKTKKGKENKDDTFNKSDLSVMNGIDEQDMEVDPNPDDVASKLSKKKKKKGKGSKKKKQKTKAVAEDTTVENENKIKFIEKDSEQTILDKTSDNKKDTSENDLAVKPSVVKKKLRSRKSNADNISEEQKDVNTTFDKEQEKNTTFDKDTESCVSSNETKSGVNTTYDKNDDTFDKNIVSTSFATFKKGALTRKSSIKDRSSTAILNITTEDLENDTDVMSSSSKRKSVRRQMVHTNDSDTEKLNSTFDKIANKDSLVKEDKQTNNLSLLSPASKRKSLRRQTIDLNDSTMKTLDSNYDKVSTRKSRSLVKEDTESEKISLLSPASKRKSLRQQTIDINESITKSYDSTFDKKLSLVCVSIETMNDSLLSAASKRTVTTKSNSTFDKTPNKQSQVKEDFEANKVNLMSPTLKRKSLRRQTIEISDLPAEKSNSTFDKTPNKKSLVKEDVGPNKVHLLSPTLKRKSLRRQTVEISDSPAEKSNSTFDKTPKKQSLAIEDFEVNKVNLMSPASRRKSIRRQTIDITESPAEKSNSTFDKTSDCKETLAKREFASANSSLSSPSKRKSLRRQTIDLNNSTQKLDSTYDKSSNNEMEPKRKSPRLSEAVEQKLNTTFEKETEKLSMSSLNSLMTSDNSASDKSEISRISITSDDTVEDIGNTTPVLIESSMEASLVKDSPKKTPGPQTPLKREGTFTKDGPEVEPQLALTPSRLRLSSSTIPQPGCTPYHLSRSSQKKPVLNVTRSIEKRSSIDLAPRLTRVMFCSPVDNPALVAQQKRKVIKSNLKGSNKSFVFDESASVSRPGRKRSYTQSDAEDSRAKRSRLTEDLQHSVNRLSRPRTTSAAAKLTDTTPRKHQGPFRSKSESKPVRTRLPNFAALHQKQFDKMESLDECQERKARRAKHMLTPTGPTNVLDRVSPKNETESQTPKLAAKEPVTKEPAKPKDKTETPIKKPFTLESLRPGFTRFGFKLNLDVPNPFSVPPKHDKPKEKLNGILPKAVALPSLAGATSTRREAAKQTVMREKSFLEKKRNLNRSENRTIIKGVRTNRRFELQMKLRNID